VLGGLGLSLLEGLRVSDIAIRTVGHDWVIEGDVRRGGER